MRRQDVSIEDIALAAGVSHSTVSRALRDSTLISAEVRERIQHLAQQMGYTPNGVARSLQNRRTHSIGLVVTAISDPFFGDVVKGVEEVAQAGGYSLVLSASHNDPEQEMNVIETFHHRRVDGILVAASRISDIYKERLDHIQVPTVLINSQAESQHQLLHWVAVDDDRGAQLAVEHLLHLGHRAIGYLGVESRPKSQRQRLEGYRKALVAANIGGRENWEAIASDNDASHESDVAAGRALVPRLVEAGVTAIFCYNDMVAVGVLLACHERGIVVPQDLSVVGYDDIPTAAYVMPPLTTIHQPKVQLGQQAMEMLLDLLNGREVQNRVLAPSLTLRTSTAAPSHS